MTPPAGEAPGAMWHQLHRLFCALERNLFSVLRFIGEIVAQPCHHLTAEEQSNI